MELRIQPRGLDGVSSSDGLALAFEDRRRPTCRVDCVPFAHRVDGMRLEGRPDLVHLEDLGSTLLEPAGDDRPAPAGGAAGSHEPSPCSPHLDDPERLEARERFTEHGARDTELVHEAALRREAVSALETVADSSSRIDSMASSTSV